MTTPRVTFRYGSPHDAPTLSARYLEIARKVFGHKKYVRISKRTTSAK